MSADKGKGRTSGDGTPDSSGSPDSGKPVNPLRQAALDRQGAPRKKFNAPLLAGAIVVLAVIAVVLYAVLTPKAKLTVDGLKSPAVAALGGGDSLYAPNSQEGMTEIVKFGYLPAVELGLTADGTAVVANPDTAQTDLGLDKALAQTSTKDFSDAKIKPRKAAKSKKDGTPMTWDEALDKLGDSTVFVPELSDGKVVAPFLDGVSKHGRADAVIARSSKLGVLAHVRAFDDDKIATMYEVPPKGKHNTPNQAHDGGATMAAVPADAKDLNAWLKSDLKIWVTGVKDKKQLDALAERGAFGALAHNPFTIQPSAVKTD